MIVHVMSKKEVEEHNKRVEKWWKSLSEEVKWDIYSFLSKYFGGVKRNGE